MLADCDQTKPYDDNDHVATDVKKQFKTTY